MKTTIDIDGMHCPACVERLTRAFEGVPGVESARVTLRPPRAELESDRPLAPEEVEGAVRAAGSYTIRAAGAPADATPIPSAGTDDTQPAPSLYPLWLILAFITGIAALTTLGRDGAVRTIDAAAAHEFLNAFMAGFFLVFSFFKLLNLRGFAASYRMYDLLARAVPAWGFIYPFAELALGAAYLLHWNPAVTNAATLALMLLGAAGVLRAITTKSAIRCACLGTALNLPLTTVTLAEDLGMGAMAAVMLIWRG